MAAHADDGMSKDISATTPAANHALPPVPALAPRRRRQTSRTTWNKKTSQNNARAINSTRTSPPSFCRCVPVPLRDHDVRQQQHEVQGQRGALERRDDAF